MRRPGALWSRRLFEPAPLVDLALARILWVGVQLAWLAAGDVPRRLHAAGTLFPERYEPLPLLQLLALPLGGAGGLDIGALVVVHRLTLLAGALAWVGFRTRVTLAAFAWGNGVVFSWLYSFGAFHHPEALITVALGALALAPSGRALSLDALRASAGAARHDAFARWPLVLVAALLGLAYLSAAAHKIGRGLAWADGATLRYWAYSKGREHDTLLGVWLSGEPFVARLLSCAMIGFEGTFLLALLVPRARGIYVAAGIAAHTLIYLTVAAPFPQFIALYAALTPWRRPASRLPASATRASADRHSTVESGRPDAA